MHFFDETGQKGAFLFLESGVSDIRAMAQYHKFYIQRRIIMKKVLSICLVAIFALAFLSLPVFAETDAPYVYVTIADENGELVLASQYVSLTHDGMTIDDALRLAHEQADYAEGYLSEDSQWGRSMVCLWGAENGGSYGYYVNNASPASLLDEVKTGDHVYAFVYTDTMNFSDTYSFFNEHIVYDLARGNELTLTLSKAGFDANWMPVTAPVAGATITVNGKATEFITDENGEVTVVLSNAGKLVISAEKEGENLTPPVCLANVSGIPNAVIYPMLGVVAFILVLVIGVVIGIVFYTVKITGKAKEDE